MPDSSPKARFIADSRLVEESLPGGGVVWRNSIALPDQRPDIFDRLVGWAATVPDRPLLTEPSANGRRSLTYGETLAGARKLRRVLEQAHGLCKGDAVASLVPAGIDALLLKLACLAGGFVHIALPPFPFRDGGDNEAAQSLLEALPPKLLVAPQGHVAVDTLSAISIADLLAANAEGLDGDIPHAPHDWAAVFFTSGSTGAPKGVPITRGMISSNQAAIAALWPFLTEAPPVLVDWLPWHHVFGGLDNIFKIIWNGGTMHVDAAPGPKTMAASIALMQEVEPTLHIGVPLGLRLLLDRLETDGEAAQAFTKKLRAIFFAGAGIDAELWRRLAEFRDAQGTFEILSGYGATEAASTICLSPAPLERPGELGHPLPGHRIRLAEMDGRTELRVAGPNIAPCYLIGGKRVALPVDEDGFYRTGDAAILRSRADGIPVFAFDGRLAEDFKLSSGVKVRTGPLRAGLLAQCAPLADDIVVAGENCERLVALVFPSRQSADTVDLLEKLAERIGEWNAANSSSSTRIARFDVASEPADRAQGELSDKGQIVQSRYLRNHQRRFEALQAGEGHAPTR
ncbi:AMP-binding protein [Oryzicola mucosus]|uniref:AMP-binding protein n=1 Tax=Oryzicola mucosus TaxID=2767425 RepID=A0A8J6PWC5_9HYPH|nr:AMP-binding protein [Oryzicola mucosus]MBD0415328.1 AMP-binding protein [Oryzicola mucosus]